MNLVQNNKKRVLIVDDEPMIVDLACEFLKSEGFETTGVNTTTEALQSMQKDPAHAVLLDVRLPGENGLIFLKQLKELFPEVPVVMLTGSGYDPSIMQAAMKNGASGYISKESEMETMVSTVKQLFE